MPRLTTALRASGRPKNSCAKANERKLLRQLQLRSRRHSFNFESAIWDCRKTIVSRNSAIASSVLNEIDHNIRLKIFNNNSSYLENPHHHHPIEYTISLHKENNENKSNIQAQSNNINFKHPLMHHNSNLPNSSKVNEELLPKSDGLRHNWTADKTFNTMHQKFAVIESFFKEYHSNNPLPNEYVENADNESQYAQATLERAMLKGDDVDVCSAVGHIDSSLELEKKNTIKDSATQAIDLYTFADEVKPNTDASVDVVKPNTNNSSDVFKLGATPNKSCSIQHIIENNNYEIEDNFKHVTAPKLQDPDEQGLKIYDEYQELINSPELIESHKISKISPSLMYQLLQDPQRQFPCLYPKAVIFDLDGTMLDTAPDIIDACNATLRHYGFDPISDELALTKITAGMRELLKLGIPEAEQSKLDISGVMREYFAQYYLNHICERTIPFRGIFELINNLIEANIKVGVVTSKYSKMAHKLLANFSFYKKLDLILGCDDTINVKPHPEPILKALEKLDVAPYEAIYVGDHINDILAANRAKVHSVAARWGYGVAECGDIKNWHAQFIIDDINDLHQLTLDTIE